MTLPMADAVPTAGGAPGAATPGAPPAASAPAGVAKPEAAGKAGDAEAPEVATFVLEENKRLSESLLWTLQRSFYASQGPQAWKPKGGVPFYVTSNPYVATAYARVLTGLLRDLVNAGSISRESPVYLVELAAGSGKFSYLLLRRLLERVRAIPALAPVTLRYVMTDFAPTNVAAWQKNERLTSLVEQGVLDFALLDLERDRQVKLVGSGETLAKGSVKNPLLAVANYAFDTTVQDAFFVKGGALQEGRATLLSTQAEKDPQDPALLERASLRFEPRPMKGSYYDDPAANQVLERYRQRLGDTCFLVPVGALHAIRTLREWSGSRLFLLCGDKGVSYEEDLLSRRDPTLAFHGGSVSMMVNFHALGAYFEELGGAALHGSERDNRFRVSALMSGLGEVPEARLAFHEAMDGLTPSQYSQLIQELRSEYTKPSLEAILAFLRLSEWDGEVFLSWREALRQHLSKASDTQKAQVLAAMRRVWDSSYPMQRDLAFDLARLCLVMKEAPEALRYSQESLRLYGDHHLTLSNCAVAHTMIGEYQEGLRCLERALALEPTNIPARELKIRLEAKLEGR